MRAAGLTGLAAVLAVAVVMLAAGRMAAPHAAPVPATQPAFAGLQIVPRLALSPGTGSTSSPGSGSTPARLPGVPWVLSFDLRLAPGSRLSLAFGSKTQPLALTRGASGPPVLHGDGFAVALPDRPSWASGGWRHFEATDAGGHGLTVDGVPIRFAPRSGGALAFSIHAGTALVDALIISEAGDRDGLLLHRLAELHARTPQGRFAAGADRSDRLHFSLGWTSGFWPGSLWRAAALVPTGGMFARWALAATISHFGREHADTHDVGFLYGQSSLSAWRALCRGRSGPPALCAHLRQSVLSAADELRTLAGTNPAGTIPTNSTSPTADTIIDSTMNVAILPWASRVTGNHAYERLASSHAHRVASLLTRADGSTSQSVHFDRATGRVLFIHTHQGLSNTSTWSRGQAWAVYGFAQAAADLRDRKLLFVAERVASYVARRLPGGEVPRWDYDAPSSGPVDVSAGVITAAGLMHLDAACRSMPGACKHKDRWVPLARRMLDAALRYAGDRPPLGLLSGQVLNEHGAGCWCNGGELMFGLSYALEAIGLERGAGP